MQAKPEMIDRLAQELSQYFPSKVDFERLKADLQSPSKFRFLHESEFSISKAIRGIAAQQKMVLNRQTAEEDIAYSQKALGTGTTPGSYLVPAIQANEIIALLAQASIYRAAGARIWPMNGIEKLNVPTATASPTVEWLGENTAQTASDPNLGQLAFDLRTLRSLSALPNELLTTSSPAIDTIVTDLLAKGFGEAEDTAFTATTSVANGPTSIYAVSGTTTVNAAGDNANGGTLVYNDLLTVIDKAYRAKAKGPFAWYCHPRTFFQRILGLLDLQSRPIVTQDSLAPIGFRLFGFPVFVSPNVPINQAVGSGTNQSYLVFANPTYIHIATPPTGLEIKISQDFFFDRNQVGVRGVERLDYGYAPLAGIAQIRGIS